MTEYPKLYRMLYNAMTDAVRLLQTAKQEQAVTDAIWVLQQAQQNTEDSYMTNAVDEDGEK